MLGHESHSYNPEEAKAYHTFDIKEDENINEPQDGSDPKLPYQKTGTHFVDIDGLSLPNIARESYSDIEFSDSELWLEDHIKPGEMITDQFGRDYIIMDSIGSGAMGSVYSVQDQHNGMVRAVKFLLNNNINDQRAVKRFDREIKMLAKMQNPFILTAIDKIELDIEGNKITGLVTELVDGPDLSKEIMGDELMDLREVAEYASEIAMALEAMRKVGIVHRDVKPSNIFLQNMSDDTRIARLGDFGIAKPYDESTTAESDLFVTGESSDNSGGLTNEGTVVGTPTYMSPEQTFGDKVTHKSDLYSLGLVMYKMITAKLPFKHASTAHDMMIAHRVEKPMSFEERGVDDVPRWLENIVFKLLEKEPEDRFNTGLEVFAAIKEGVKKDFPDMMYEIPFMYQFEKGLKREPIQYKEINKQMAEHKEVVSTTKSEDDDTVGMAPPII